MFSVDDINEMQKTIDRQNRIITVLKRTVKQWVKEYNILDEIIDMYKMSENEANEIIAELEAEKRTAERENLKFRWDNPYFDLYNNVVKQRDMWEEKSKQYKTCLQEIKAIVKSELPYKTAYLEDAILQKITKAEEE